MSTQGTYEGWESWDHWQTALWISNEMGLYGILTEATEQVVYQQMSRPDAVNYILDSLPEQTPDGAEWKRDVVARLLDQEYDEMIQYS